MINGLKMKIAAKVERETVPEFAQKHKIVNRDYHLAVASDFVSILCSTTEPSRPWIFGLILTCARTRLGRNINREPRPGQLYSPYAVVHDGVFGCVVAGELAPVGQWQHLGDEVDGGSPVGHAGTLRGCANGESQLEFALLLPFAPLSFLA